MMKERTVLINILLALINQSYGTNKNHTLMDIIDEAMTLVRTPAVAGSGGDEGSLLIGLKDLILELKGLGTKEPYEKRYITARLRVLAIYFKDVVELIERELAEIADKPIEDINREYYYYHGQINTYVRESKFAKVMSEWSFRLRENPELLKDREAYVRDLNNELAPLIANGGGFKYTDIPGIVSAIDVGDTDQLTALYEETQDLYSDLGVLKFDMQGWNDMMGPNAGILRGEFAEIQAFSGCGKSETMRKMLTGMAVVNTPHMIMPDKTPLIVYLSLEDTQREIYEKMYTQLFREEHNCLEGIQDKSVAEIVEYVQAKLQSMGYKFKVIYGEKYASSPYDIINLLEAIQQDGYEIHAFGLDYMLLLNMTNVPGGMDTYKLKNGYGIIGSYTKARGITCITAAQIDDSCKYLMDESDDFAKDAVNKNVSAGSKYILHELDMRLFAHVESRNGVWYHGLAKGKHRLGKATPIEHRYAVYEMHNIDGVPAGFIRSDLEGASMVRNTVGGGLRSEGGGAAVLF